MVFAAWGAEEYGIIGSTEWVEGHRERLLRGAVAYVNLDMAAMGPNFGCACTPSLREAVLGAYHHAVANDYRFYSYGDSSLLERHD